MHHRDQTLRRRFEALFFAPMFGSEHLTAFDTHEQPLQTLLGRGYHSTTLSQFLGQLERLDAAAALRPALVPDKASQITYVDGHMIAYWSRATSPSCRAWQPMKRAMPSGSSIIRPTSIYLMSSWRSASRWP